MNDWQPDPEKYHRLRQPFATRAEAEEAMSAFIYAVSVFREQHRIPEIVLQMQVYYTEGDKTLPLSGGMGWGHQFYQARLAKYRAEEELEGLFGLIKATLDALPGLGDAFVTDLPDRDAE